MLDVGRFELDPIFIPIKLGQSGGEQAIAFMEALKCDQSASFPNYRRTSSVAKTFTNRPGFRAAIDYLVY